MTLANGRCDYQDFEEGRRCRTIPEAYCRKCDEALCTAHALGHAGYRGRGRWVAPHEGFDWLKVVEAKPQ